MATRIDVQSRREALYNSLKHACLDGSLAPGVMLPTKRELGERHGVSANVAFGVIQSLADEGVLYTVPRVGTFVGRPQSESVEPYLMLIPSRRTEWNEFWLQAQSGFEDRIAQLGGHSIVLTPSEARKAFSQNKASALAGVFEYGVHEASHLFHNLDLPHVMFATSQDNASVQDTVAFDDVDGGVQATRHLWQNGHRTIAFLALHKQGQAGPFAWSERREAGWHKAMEQFESETDGLVFHPAKTPGLASDEQLQAGRDAAEKLIGREEITAVVAANIFAAEGMFRAFAQAHWPAEKWPAIVCFDASPQNNNSVVSYLRLPWEDIGREAAQTLWERRNGRLVGAAVQRLTPMRLIPRLSCRPDWAVSSSLAQTSLNQNRVSRIKTSKRPSQSLIATGI